MERILVVESAPLRGRPAFATADREDVYRWILQTHRTLARSQAEGDPTWRQVIPYVLIRHRDRWLLLRRTSRQTEARLHHRMSIGVGGHINPGDAATGCDVIESGMKRELEEEIRLDGQYTERYIGVLCDDSDDVSRVHLGLVFVLDVDAPGFTVMEPQKMDATWATEPEIRAVRDRLETWSRILVDAPPGHGPFTSLADVPSLVR